MRRLLFPIAVLSFLTLAIACDKDEPAPEPEPEQEPVAEQTEPTPEPAAEPEPEPEPQVDVVSRREQLQASTSRACAHRVECELEGLAAALANAVDEDALCRTFRNRSNRVDLDEISEDCFDKVIGYFDCLGGADCETLEASGEEACSSETSAMTDACNGPLF